MIENCDIKLQNLKIPWNSWCTINIFPVGYIIQGTASVGVLYQTQLFSEFPTGSFVWHVLLDPSLFPHLVPSVESMFNSLGAIFFVTTFIADEN